MTHFEQACDTLDAAVFSSDALEDEGTRATFEEYLDRWQRELRFWRKCDEEDEEEQT